MENRKENSNTDIIYGPYATGKRNFMTIVRMCGITATNSCGRKDGHEVDRTLLGIHDRTSVVTSFLVSSASNRLKKLFNGSQKMIMEIHGHN
jgi:hypothetical protein